MSTPQVELFNLPPVGVCKHCLRDTYGTEVGLYVWLNEAQIAFNCDGRRWKRLGHKVRGW